MMEARFFQCIPSAVSCGFITQQFGANLLISNCTLCNAICVLPICARALKSLSTVKYSSAAQFSLHVIF